MRNPNVGASIYARKSTESEDRQALSIESQIAELTAFAQKEGLEIGAIYQESKSASKTGRPEFARMLKDLKRHPGSIILCWQLDRLARNLQDAATLTQYLQDGIIQVIRTPKAVYGNSSMDLFISGLDFLIAKKYIDDLSENVKRGLRHKVEMGWRPGQTPLGYMTSGPFRKGLRTIVPDPRTFDKVRLLWDRLLTKREPVSQLVAYAQSLGLEVSSSGLYSVFTNPFYRGQFIWKGELFDGKHYPMVTNSEFQRVQDHLTRNKGKERVHWSFAFAGLFHCGECGSRVTAEKKFKLIKSTGKTRAYTYYHCTRSRNPLCRQPYIEEQELCRQIEAHLQSITIPKERIAQETIRIRGLELMKAEQNSPSPAIYKQLLDELDYRISGLLSLKLSPTNADGSILGEDEFKREKNRLLAKRQSLIQKRSERDVIHQQVDQRVAERIELATTGHHNFVNGASPERRAIVQSIGSNHEILNKTLVFGTSNGPNSNFRPGTVQYVNLVRTVHFTQ